MRKCVPLLLMLSSIPLARGGGEKKSVAVAVDLICTETTRYHTTDEQRAAAMRDPATWLSLFQWLASFDAVRDKRCSP